MDSTSLRVKFIGTVFLPSRVLTIITLLALVPVFNISWGTATIIFQGFFPIYLASFIVEGMLSKKGLRKNFGSLGSKYAMGLPIEFAGIAGFALLSFSTKPDEAILMGIQISAVVITCGFCIEAYHNYVRPKLSKIILTDKQAIVTIIAFTVAIIYFGIYYFNLNPFR